MAVDYRIIAPIIKSALNGEGCALPSNFDIEQLIDLASEHQITNILYEGAVLCGVDISCNGMKRLFSRCCKNLMVSEEQLYEISAVCDIFEQNGIKHMPVKGTVLKSRYPKSDMREMSDADILIDPSDYPKIKETMASLGYAEQMESDHDFTFTKGKVTMEMHKYLVSASHKDMFEYFENVWERAQLVKGKKNRYELLPTENYIYIFMHLAKHYIDGGIGIKHITDMFILRDDAYDKEYVISSLKKMNLDRFYNNITDLLCVWFDGKEANEITEHISEYIINSGAYGTYENHIISQTAGGTSDKNAKNGKLKRYMQLIFPPLANMKYAYPVLKKAPILLPFVWIYRWFAVLLGKRGNISNAKKSADIVSEEKISGYVQAMQYVGLGDKIK